MPRERCFTRYSVDARRGTNDRVSQPCAIVLPPGISRFARSTSSMCELSSMSSSCPALCRASTSFVVDGRVEPGHDGYGWGPRSRAHAEFALAGLAQFFGVAGEFGEQFAGVARIDDFLDPERL